MTSIKLGFFTVEGETLAQSLFSGICADVTSDRMTRLQALDKASYALERLSEIDSATQETETLEAIAATLSTAFAQAGFVLVKPGELRRHFDYWRKHGRAVNPSLMHPYGISDIQRYASALNDRLSKISEENSIKIKALTKEPLQADAIKTGANILLYPWQGDGTGCHYAGCSLVNLNDNTIWTIERLFGKPNASSLLSTHFLPGGGFDYSMLAIELGCLSTAIERLNFMVAKINEPDRLKIEFVERDGNFEISPTWDGDLLLEGFKASSDDEERSFDASSIAESVDDTLGLNRGLFS